MKRKWIVLAPLAILAMLVFIVIGGEVVRQLWNWLLPALLGWPRISFWQALGILALCRILFGGLGSNGGGPGSRIRRRVSERVNRRVAERLEQMTPEERERFRQRMRERWGFGPPRARPRGNDGTTRAGLPPRGYCRGRARRCPVRLSLLVIVAGQETERDLPVVS